MNMLNRVLSKPVEVKTTNFELDKYDRDPFEGEPEGDFEPADFDDEDESEAEEQEAQEVEVPEEQEAEEKTKFGHVKWQNLFKHSQLPYPYKMLGEEIDDKLQILGYSGSWHESIYSMRDLLTNKNFANATADDFSPRLAALIEGE